MSSGYLRIRSFSLPAFLLMLLLSVTFAGAQNFRGGINGTVTDQGGAAIPGAQVQITDDATGVTHSSIASSAGEFDFPDLPLGSYTVSATSSGFETLKVGKVQVSAGTIYTLPVKLAVASQATTVEVNAAGLALDTTTPTQTTVLSGKTIQDIPLNGRDFTQMIGMAPGFAGYSLGGYGSVNGTRANQINWQIDGSDNNDLWHNIPAVNQGGVENIAGITLPIDSVEEFSLETQGSPESGRNPGGSVNLVTKSGTNQIHGTAYYYNRNEALAEVSPFQQGNPPLRNQQWGESAGGPFWKDHTFWFENFEKQQFKIATGFQGTEPSAAYQQQALPVLAYSGQPLLSPAPQPARITLRPLPRPVTATTGSSSWTTTLATVNRFPRGHSWVKAIKSRRSWEMRSSTITSKSLPFTSTTTPWFTTLRYRLTSPTRSRSA
jgi:hypothetical protein